jgi:hypothetical protein
MLLRLRQACDCRRSWIQLDVLIGGCEETSDGTATRIDCLLAILLGNMRSLQCIHSFRPTSIGNDLSQEKIERWLLLLLGNDLFMVWQIECNFCSWNGVIGSDHRRFLRFFCSSLLDVPPNNYDKEGFEDTEASNPPNRSSQLRV